MLKTICRSVNGETDNLKAISTIVRKARRLDLSYGQYVALYGDTEPPAPPRAEPEPLYPKKFKKICVVCGKEFLAGHPVAKYCSDKCKPGRSKI